MAHNKLEGSANLSNLIEIFKGFLRIGLILCFGLLMVSSITAQVGNGTTSPVKKDTSNNADQNLKSIARVNPSTLAMEMSVPLMTYPGRNGNSLPIGFSYSSKIWRMQSRSTWWYSFQHSNVTKYVTDIGAIFGERSAAGWTSNLVPPRIEEKVEIYNENGERWGDSIISEPALNAQWSNIISSFSGGDLSGACGLICTAYDPRAGCDLMGNCICSRYEIQYCQTNGPSFPEPPPIMQLYYIKRVQVAMPDGSTHEFRESDTPINCGSSQTGCATDLRNGTFLSVDGSGMKLVRDDDNNPNDGDIDGSILYLPDGSKYKFPDPSTTTAVGHYAEEFIDNDGNRLDFTSTPSGNSVINKWTDTLGREIIDTIPHNWQAQGQASGTQNIDLPGLGGEQQKYKIKWENLKPVGCEESTNPSCTNDLEQVGGALEDQTQKLYYETRYFCRGNLQTELLADVVNEYSPLNEVLFPEREIGTRPCNSFNILRNSLGEPILDENDLAQPYATRFNPVMLSEVELPNGKKYIFKYNRYGEISKIVYPTGSYETFTYAKITPMNGVSNPAFDQTNRGVIERKVFDSAHVMQQRNKYSATYSGNIYTVTTKSPKQNTQIDQTTMVDGIRTERDLYTDFVADGDFGFNNPLAGMPKEERTYDENNVLRSRTLTEYITKDNGNAKRDARVKRTVSVAIENGLALAILGESEYNETAVDTNNIPTTADYFSHLDVKRAKGYHYAVISTSLAQTGTLAQIAGYFNSSLLASVSETDYEYNPNYKDRGIRSLPIESRVLNPSNNEIVAKTRTIYDNAVPAASTNYPYSTETYSISGTFSCPSGTQSVTCWQSPGSSALGRPTTSRLWDDDNDVWIETHTRYDIFGNAVKVKDAAGNEAETIFENTTEKPYLYAYPTKVITPAPDPTGTHGTNEGSFATTVYDFMTGLPLTATNEFGQTTATEYNDDLLRPTRSFAVNFSAPESQTIYNDTNLTVKVRKQIDAQNWDEAITYSDSLGRTIKMQAKDSQGDVFTETEYDFLGRVKRATNPYRTGDTKLWSKPRYDEMGRAVESYAPAEDGQTGDSLGITSYGISTAEGYTGTFVLTTDAAGKQSRAITNALRQLIRVDEPDYTGAITALPQATPNPSPSPTPSGPPHIPPPTCSIECLNNTQYPSHATVYRYNAQGKMVEVTQGEQKRFFKYDSLGRLIRVKQPEQETNDALDMNDFYNTSGKWTAGFTYDLTGNVLTATDANGTVITNTYDKANRVKTKTYTTTGNIQATPQVRYYYDGKCSNTDIETNPCPSQQTPNYAKGKLTQVISSVSETRYTEFDYLGRLKQLEQRTPFSGETLLTAEVRVSKYQYNFAGALIEEEYPSGAVVKNEFEADGDLSRIYGKANPNAIERTYANGFSYTPDGRIQRLRLGNGRWESAKFNERLQVTEMALGASDGDGSLWKLKYEYGEFENGDVNTAKNTGNIARQTISFNGLPNPLVQTFKYDSLYRLKEARETDGTSTNAPQVWKETFDYDRFGNRTGREKITGESTSLSINQINTPTIDPNTNRFADTQVYDYDKNGNLIQYQVDENVVRTVVFDGNNKQKYVVENNQNVGEYTYDGEGKRVKKKVYNPNGSVREETVFVYSGGKLVEEYSTSTEPAPENPTTKWTATDQLGSPRVITDSLGNVVSRRDFLPFGEEITNNIGERQAQSLKYNVADGIRQKFTGYQKDDETSLDFAEARMYENRHGRFTAVDPLLASGKSTNPQTFNRYTYCLNNPLIFTDPSGLQAGEWVGRPSKNGDGTLKLIYTTKRQDDDVNVTYTNKFGELVANVPGSSDFVYRLNPKGPADAVQLAWSKLTGISKYDADGYDYTYSEDFLTRVNNDPNPGLKDVTLDLLLALEGPLLLTRGFGKVALERGVGRGGSYYADEVLEGGVGNVRAGHGEYRFGSGDTIVPDGNVFIAPAPNTKIAQESGLLLEKGGVDALAEAAKTNARAAQDLASLRTYNSGDLVPNYTLKPPTNLTVYRNSVTVEDPTPLSELWGSRKGCIIWAACTEYRNR